MTSPLSRPAASSAVAATAWRLVLGTLVASVPVAGLNQALAVAAAAAEACGGDADDHLRIDVRADRVELALQFRTPAAVTARDAELAVMITAAVQDGLGLAFAPPTGPARPVQLLEIAIDAMDIPAVRPFWKAVLGYEDEPGAGPAGGLVDPARQLPTIWFQQMDEPRLQRNRIHFDLDVAHDEAPARIQAALDAGGVLVSEAEARAFWILADGEGNEICICTWQDRD
ncbi:MAG: 4a-hydroxytetrahydrobiopterin dehydratase [Pseudonocardiales bacterium]|nr:4a-hydroxytetrahydrobiopterin dehydratase [Pseudonocardiales bacterium]